MVRNGGEGDDLVRTIAWLAAAHGSVAAFVDFVLAERGGWKTLVPPEPLSASSGVHPFRVTDDDFRRHHLGDERGVFLAPPDAPERIEAWRDGVVRGRIRVISPAVAEIAWSDGIREVVEKPAAIVEAERRPPPPGPAAPRFEAKDLPPGFAMGLAEQFGPDLGRAIVQAVRTSLQKVPPREVAYLISDDSDDAFTKRAYGDRVAALPVAPRREGPVLRVCTHGADGRWKGGFGTLALTETSASASGPLAADALRGAFAYALRFVAPGEEIPLVWIEPFPGRRRLVPDLAGEQGLAELGRAQLLLLLWSGRP